MKKIKGSIYDFPKYYDLVFASEWKPEFTFMEDVFEKYVDGEVKQLFEPACGTGRLLFRFGQAGYEVGGNDLNANAIDYCNQRLAKHDLKPTATVGDMTQFELANPVDAAFNTINSFRHLTEHQQALAHLDCMAKAVRPGGVYVLGLHLTPTVGQPSEEEYWTASKGQLTVSSSMWLLERKLAKRYEAFGMNFDVRTPEEQFRIQDVIRFRTYTVPQIKQLIAEASGFELVAAHDFRYDIEEPIKLDRYTEDVLLVLKKTMPN